MLLNNEVLIGQVEDLLTMPGHDMSQHKVPAVENYLVKDHINSNTDTLLYYPVFDNGLGYCDFPTIEKYQKEDDCLQQGLQTNPKLFIYNTNNCLLVCSHTTDGNWKNVLMDDLLPKIVRWYHEFLVHSKSSTKLCKTISRHFIHPELKKIVELATRNCDICKIMKAGHQQQGQLAPQIATCAPWEEVHVDCIGNWSFKISKNVSVNLRALTMIDSVKKLLETVKLNDVPTAATVMRAFKNT